MVKVAKVRLFVESSLSSGAMLDLDSAAAHYAGTVMRLGVGASLVLFNGRDGEWQAMVTETGHRSCAIIVQDMLRPQATEADIWIVAAPIKYGSYVSRYWKDIYLDEGDLVQW